MRLFLLPLSTRRTLLYAQRFEAATAADAAKRSYLDRGTEFAARTWASWEKMDKGWKRKVVDYGNQAFRRIPYEEWGLKSVPPLSKRRQEEELKAGNRVELCFPGSVIPPASAEGILRKLATEREALHRKRLLWCCIGMPVTIPFALVPVIPNLPFFYLVFRAWSHWRAIAGGKHVQFLLDNKLVVPKPLEKLDHLYRLHAPAPEEPDNKERALLTQKDVQTFSAELDIPALEIELERAIWQVEQAAKDPSETPPPPPPPPPSPPAPEEKQASTSSPGSSDPREKKNQ